MYILGHLKTLKVYLFLLVGSVVCCSFWLHDFASTGKITHEISAGNKRLHYSLCFQNQWLEIFKTIREKSSNNLIQTKGTKILGWTTFLILTLAPISMLWYNTAFYLPSTTIDLFLESDFELLSYQFTKIGSFKKHYY